MITTEHSILKLLLDKSLYLRYNNILNNIYNKEDIYLYNILKALEACHSKTETPTLEDVHVQFRMLHPNLSQKDRALYDEIFSLISTSDADPTQIQALLDVTVQKQSISDLALKAFEASQTGKLEAFQEALSKFQNGSPTVAQDEYVFVTDNLEELYNEQVKKPGLRWRLKSLNQSLGSLRKGDLGVVFARPETGKTTFLASEVSFMATQTDAPILWFNNEQEGKVVKIRIVQASLGLPLEKLFSNIKKNQEAYLKLTKGNIKLYDDASLSKGTIERICKQLQPSLILFDQIDKIKGFQSDRNDLELGAIYQWARELAKAYAPVIGICQADGTAEGQKWLHMGHMANAKTSKQAEADFILGIGMSNDAGLPPDLRHFNISKNKLFGDEDTLPTMRHARIDVLIEPTIARYKDIING